MGNPVLLKPLKLVIQRVIKINDQKVNPKTIMRNVN